MTDFHSDDWEAEMDGWEQLSDEALRVALELADDATEDDMIRAIAPRLIANAMAAQPSADWRAELDALDADEGDWIANNELVGDGG